LAFANKGLANRAQFSEQAAGWFKKRALKNQAAQQRKMYNFQAYSGQLAFGSAERNKKLSKSRVHWAGKVQGYSAYSKQHRPARPPGSGLGAMPPALEKLRQKVLGAKWPEGSALEFVANHVFVVQRKSVAKDVRTLLERTHDFRNQRAVSSVAFPLVGERQADSIINNKLSSSQAKALAAGKSLRPTAYVIGRADSRCEVFVGQMHTALASAWAPDRSSPAVHVYWRGVRIAALPRLGRNGGRGLGLRVKHHRLSRLATRRVAGAVMQQPVDATWSHHANLHIRTGENVLSGLSSTREGLVGLLVTPKWLP
jgi:hypothetical protein